MAKKQNILLIIIDCLGADFVYKKGNSYIPTIDKIKKEGFFFTNTIATTTTTTPSFASFLTGLYPFQNGVRSHSGYSLKKDIKTFPEILKENGYNTYAEVTGPLGKEIALSKGFDKYNYRLKKEIIHSEFGNKLIEKLKNEYKSPWFLMLHIWSLHEPRIVIDQCRSKKYGNTKYGRALASIDVYLSRLLKEIDDDTLVIIIGDHGEYIANSKIDKFWKTLRFRSFRIMKKIGLIKKPFALGVKNFHISHGYSVYDKLLRIPLIFYNKKLVKPGNTEKQVRQIDIFPTIFDILKIEFKNEIEGISLFPLIYGKDIKTKDAYVEAVGIVIPNKDEWLAGLRIDNKYKYIYYPFRKDNLEELYDLENDPQENNNIANQNKELIKKFRKKIKGMKTEKLTGEKLSEEDQKRITKRLKALGYMD